MAEPQYAKGYPVFTEVEKYMKRRAGRTLLGLLKTRAERRALMRCLKGLPEVRTVCDVPSGPGRLFPFWKRMGFRVHGLDISEPMVRAAEKALRTSHLPGSVRLGDAFNLPTGFGEIADLAISVRFAYYFCRRKRTLLLLSLAGASRRYVLVQYKTLETIKGRVNLGRKRHKNTVTGRASGKYYCSYEEIVNEVAEAGLSVSRIVPISEFSDRVFVLMEKPEQDSLPGLVQCERKARYLRPRRAPFAATVATIAGTVIAGL